MTSNTALTWPSIFLLLFLYSAIGAGAREVSHCLIISKKMINCHSFFGTEKRTRRKIL